MNCEFRTIEVSKFWKKCQLCDRAIKYVRVIFNSDTGVELRVGKCCAAQMMGGMDELSKAEKLYKLRKRWLTNGWRESDKGNYTKGSILVYFNHRQNAWMLKIGDDWLSKKFKDDIEASEYAFEIVKDSF